MRRELVFCELIGTCTYAEMPHVGLSLPQITSTNCAVNSLTSLRPSPQRVSVVHASWIASAVVRLTVFEVVAGRVVRLRRREERTQFITWLYSHTCTAEYLLRTNLLRAVSYTHLTLPTIYSV